MDGLGGKEMTTIREGLNIIINATLNQGPVDTALIRTHATGILACLDEYLPWRPISELDEKTRYGNEDGFLLLAPELVNLDCNTYGVGMGYYQDDGLLWHMTQEECDNRDQTKDYGCWMACVWSMYNDKWAHIPVTPTHYLRLKGVEQ